MHKQSTFKQTTAIFISVKDAYIGTISFKNNFILHHQFYDKANSYII